MNVTAVLGIGIITAVLGVLLKQYKPEYAIVVVLAGSAVILGYVVIGFTPILSEINSIMNDTNISKEDITIVIKALGIGYLSQFAGDICKDAGETAIASKLEFAGKVAIMLVSFPLIKKLFEVATDLLS